MKFGDIRPIKYFLREMSVSEEIDKRVDGNYGLMVAL
jgi:hypothetical protein